MSGSLWMKRWRAFMLAGLVVAMLALGLLAVAGLGERATLADIIVVPGNFVAEDGTPSPRLAARLDAAVVLYRQGSAPLILVSGGHGASGAGYDESLAMRDYLLRQGLPRAAIVRDDKGIDTYATAANTALFLQGRRLRTALVATQWFHVPRTRLALERAGVKVVGGRYARYVEWRDGYSALRELVGYAAYCTGVRTMPVPQPVLPD